MSYFMLIHDAEETLVREAHGWESGLAARQKDGAMGVGFVLSDEDGHPIGGALMSAQHALEQARVLFRIASRLRFYEDSAKASEAIRDMLGEVTLATLDHSSRAAR